MQIAITYQITFEAVITVLVLHILRLLAVL